MLPNEHPHLATSFFISTVEIFLQDIKLMGFPCDQDSYPPKMKDHPAILNE